MSGERMRAGTSALLTLTAVALGLGLVWFISSSGATGAVDPALLSALALAATAVALTSAVLAVRTLGAVIAAMLGASARPRPDDDVELPVVVLQSRPDAPGRPRTRAPGRLLAAA
ncbi:DUF6412 domain-containing protein [Herbiconiux liangxiaofengii]|uniref:DUF6412 domain-containing protein n=1 Tax=Herbiconiux liangxiaofengii TaxID=3342795 RepID=UPI0035BA05D0